MNSKFGWQFIGKPPESYRALCGGSKGIKIVGNEDDLTQLRDWNVEIKQARLITAEERIRGLIETTAIADIRTLARQIAAEYAAAAARLNVAGVWWEIPYIMPEVSAKTCAWYPAAAEEFRAVGLRSVPWGFATGTPQTAPWANASSPDEWPQLYDGLARLHALGPQWVVVGVEEYVTDGRLIPGDYSNCGRILEVYNRHIKPHGWNIVFRGIEAGYDIPGMHDAGITAHNVLTGRNEGNDGTGGLANADARYASMPFVDCMYLYQVSDPGVVQNEAAFAFTPGDKNGPGLLDTMQQYFIANPPVPFVPPAGGGGGTPPVDPPPTNQPGPNLIVNPDFTGGTYAVPGNPNQQQVPNGWGARNATDHVEIEYDPHFNPPAARVWEAWENKEVGLRQSVSVEAGATYRITMIAAGWCTTDPSSPFAPSDSDAELRLTVNGSVVAVFPFGAGRMPDDFASVTTDVVASGATLTVGAAIKPVWAVTRTDIRIDSVSLQKIAGGTPPVPPPPQAPYDGITTGKLNARLGKSDSGQLVGIIPTGSTVKVLDDDGARATIQVSILREYIKPK